MSVTTADRRGRSHALAGSRAAERAQSERFLSRSMVAGLTIYGLFAVTFAAFQIKGDALVYFNMMRRFFGEKPDFAFAYQFGSDVWNAPFFLVGKGLGAIFGFQPRIFHVSFEEISITVATQVGFVVTLWLGWRILRELELPAGPAILFLTTFGSPLFFYVIFDPAMKHAVDTLVMTAAVYLLLLVITRKPAPDRLAIALGALVGLSLNIRYVNIAFFLAVACALALYRRRALVIGAATAALVGPAIFALPALRGVSYYVPDYFPKSSALGGEVTRYALGHGSVIASTSNPLNGFDPLTPLKMLFSDHRGLFVWTPLTALAVIGFVLLLRRRHEHDRYIFLWTLLAASVALLAAHSIWGFWDGAFSFSTRFLTALFPLFLVGAAELRRRFGKPVYLLFAVCAAWSLLLALVHVVGYDNITAGDGAGKTVRVYFEQRSNIDQKIHRKASQRWGYLWGLANGRDPEHVQGP
jgi:hypothetical protein